MEREGGEGRGKRWRWEGEGGVREMGIGRGGGAREEGMEPLVVLWPLGVLPHLVLSVVLAQDSSVVSHSFGEAVS